MIFILLCIIFCTYLVVCLKLFQKYKVNGFQGIVFNYIAAFLTGLIIEKKFPSIENSYSEGWIFYALYLGVSFIFFFNVMELITRKIGPTVTSISGKLSLVIPVLLGFIFFKEAVTILKILGILFALVAVIFTASKEKNQPFNFKNLMWPLLLFFGSGINDSMVKMAQANCLNQNNFDAFNMSIFGIAASMGLLLLIIQLSLKKQKLEIKNVIGGIALGVPNYFSLIFLIKALAQPGYESTLVFPFVNIGIVLLTGICGYFMFNEKFTRLNFFGLVLSIISLILIAFSI